MLALTRKPNQYVTLKNKHTGEVIRICAVECKWNIVKLGFEASLDWDISRDEAAPKKIPSIEERSTPNGG